MRKCPECGAQSKISHDGCDPHFTFDCETVTIKGEIIYRGLACRLNVAERTITLMQEQIRKLQATKGRGGW